MYSPISANASISDIRRAISRTGSPMSCPAIITFWRPLKSGWKPIPSSSNAATRPPSCTCPSVGWVVPVRILSSVLFPAPFRPMMPTDSPDATMNVIPRSAQKVSCQTRRPPAAHSQSRCHGRA